jgi:GxxExxY protein
MSTDDLIQSEHDADGYALIGACFDVYNEMGNGYLEDVYQESTEIELTERGIPFIAQPKLPIFYKGRQLRKQYQADLIVLDKIIVEIKTVKTLLPEHEAQLLNYLKAIDKRVGCLVNFGAYPKLDRRRRLR